jgi:5-methylcytosine-specific restriction enzyme A
MVYVRKRTAWDAWHKKQRWRNRSAMQLQDHPLCVMCLDQGIVMPATVADHFIPHRGDPQLFWFGCLQSLCWPHHNGTKQQEEKKGFSHDIGADGFPTDARHPFNRVKSD